MVKECIGCKYARIIPRSNRFKCTKYNKTLLNYPPEPLEECTYRGEVKETKKEPEVSRIVPLDPVVRRKLEILENLKKGK